MPLVSFSTTDYALGGSLVDSTKLKVDYAGLYNIQFSAQLINNTNDVQEVSIWFRKNGSDVVGSNSEFGVPQRKSTGTPSRVIAGLNYFIANGTSSASAF